MVVVSVVGLVAAFRASLVVAARTACTSRDMPDVAGVVAVATMATVVVMVGVAAMSFMFGMDLLFMAVVLMVPRPAWLEVGPTAMACMVLVVGGFSFAITMSPLLAGFCFVVRLMVIAAMEMFMLALVLVIAARSVLSAACLVTRLGAAFFMAAGRNPVHHNRLT